MFVHQKYLGFFTLLVAFSLVCGVLQSLELKVQVQLNEDVSGYDGCSSVSISFFTVTGVYK